MPYLSRNFSVYAFWDNPKFLNDVTENFNPNQRSCLAHIFHCKFLREIILGLNRPRSLLANKISSTYITKHMNLPPLILRYTHGSMIFSLKPNFVMVSSNFKYHFSRFFSVHKLVSLVCRPCLPLRFDYEAFRLTILTSCKSLLRKAIL